MGCYNGVCHTCWGAKHVVLGVIVLANWYWKTPVDWWLLAGVLLVLLGLLKIIKPTCPHCAAPEKASVAAKSSKKGR